MKKYTSVFVMLFLLVGFTACGDSDSGAGELPEMETVPDPAAPPVVNPSVTEGAIIMDTSAIQSEPVADTAGS